MGLPERHEAAPYYFTYIDRISSGDIAGTLATQLEETLAILGGITEEKSSYRYAPGKWSIREVLSHVNDTERVFLYRALWFARGLDGPLPSFDQDAGVKGTGAAEVPWTSHVEEFRAIRMATLCFIRNLSAAAWMRSGIASGNSVTVRALAYIIAGHVAHHVAILQERYL